MTTLPASDCTADHSAPLHRPKSIGTLGRGAVAAGVFLVASLTGNAAGAPVPGGDLHVPGDAETIQEAIALATEGMEIVVAPGVYAEAIDFLGKAITVRSAEGAAVTVIDASSLSGVSAVGFVNNEGPASILDGFTITGGSGSSVRTFVAGGGVLAMASSPTVLNCVFVGNTAVLGGGAFVGDGSQAIFTGCLFTDNDATSGGGLYASFSSPTLTGCTFEANSANIAGGMRNAWSDSTIVECAFIGNYSLSGGAGLGNHPSSNPHVERCIFVDNETDSWGGAIYNLDGSSPTVVDCRFIGNVASAGGAATNHNFGTPLYVNCLFAGNTAALGGALFDHSDGAPTIVNCTFVDNVATQSGGAVRRQNNAFGQGKAHNSIFVGGSDPQISHVFSSPLIVRHSIVPGGWPGDGNIDAVPDFVNPAGPGGADNHLTADYRLAAGSPGIDAGDNALVPDGIVTDLAGAPRFVDDPNSPDCPQAPGTCGEAPVVDMGAYEFQGAPSAPSADLNGDGIVDGADLGILLSTWGPCKDCPADLNGDGIVDGADLGILLAAWTT